MLEKCAKIGRSINAVPGLQMQLGRMLLTLISDVPLASLQPLVGDLGLRPDQQSYASYASYARPYGYVECSKGSSDYSNLI